MKTRFTAMEPALEEGASSSVHDIVEVGDADSVKKTRARLMRQFGFMVNQLLRDEISEIYVGRDL